MLKGMAREERKLEAENEMEVEMVLSLFSLNKYRLDMRDMYGNKSACCQAAKSGNFQHLIGFSPTQSGSGWGWQSPTRDLVKFPWARSRTDSVYG